MREPDFIYDDCDIPPSCHSERVKRVEESPESRHQVAALTVVPYFGGPFDSLGSTRSLRVTRVGATLGRQGRTRRPGPVYGRLCDAGRSQSQSLILRARRPHHNGVRIRGSGPQPRPKQPPTSWTLRPGGVPGPALCRHSDPERLPSRTMPYLAPSGITMKSVSSSYV